MVTRNVAREGLRLYPASWIIGRVATIDGDFAGVPVPAGCTVSISPFVTHRHPQFWVRNPGKPSTLIDTTAHSTIAMRGCRSVRAPGCAGQRLRDARNGKSHYPF